MPFGIRARSLLTTAAVTFGVLVFALILDSETVARGPITCPLRAATGLPCPGCGLTRSFVALFDGELRRSIAFHPAGPLLAFSFFVSGSAALYGVKKRIDPFAITRTHPARVMISGLAVVWILWWLTQIAGHLVH